MRRLASLICVSSMGLILMVSPLCSAEPALPKLIDLGSKTCIPCQLLWPILDELKIEQAGKIGVEFIDVGLKENLELGKKFGIEIIPTQIFLDKDGKELWRHEGYISKWAILEKWKELGVVVAETGPTTKRLEPAMPDTRPRDRVCFMCDGDIAPETKVVVKTEKGEVNLCSLHHLFIMLSCLQEDVEGTERSARVADSSTGDWIDVVSGLYLWGIEERTGLPWIKAFSKRMDAEEARNIVGGSILDYHVLKSKELAPRCGFCDRSVYPEEAALVKIEGVFSWGCCAHCAMGCAARTGKDIEVHQPDRLTGEMVIVQTLGGYVSSVEPKTSVAWYGLRKTKDGGFASAGCFHQGFFIHEENLQKWLEETPYAMGRAITIDQSLADKMKMSPAQILNACKIGECAPR